VEGFYVPRTLKKGGFHLKPIPKTRLALSVVIVLLAAILTSLGACSSAQSTRARAASDITITEFPIPTSYSYPHGITKGPDGNVWFTAEGTDKIGKITPSGVVTEFSLPISNSYPDGITAGPDGNLWFTENSAGKIGKITPSGVITEFPLPTSGSYPYPYGITTGMDGNLWFTEPGANQIGKITPGGIVSEFPVPTSGSYPYGITTSPNGDLWFAELSAGKIGKITSSGAFTEYPLPITSSNPKDITAGPDGNVWFTEIGANQVGKITPSGSVSEYPVPSISGSPSGITAGPDGNVWFTEYGAGKVAQITHDGAITEFATPGANSGPWSLTTGADGNLWFIENTANNIGRVNLNSVTPTATPSPTPVPHRSKLFVLVQGLTSTLSDSQAQQGGIPDTFGQKGGIYTFLQQLYPDAKFQVYSYKGSNKDGSPQSYTCGYTFKDHIKDYVKRLRSQVISYLKARNTPHNFDVYLIGHSMGGALSFALLADMELNGYIHVNGSKIAGVITLDSPLGGVPDGINGAYLSQAETYYKESCSDMVRHKNWKFTSLNDIAAIFTYIPNQAYGATASIMYALNGNPSAPDNGQIAEKAHSDQGITVLTVGNPVDYVYDFQDCPLGTTVPYGQFLSTQWDTDDPLNAVYGRYFPDTGPACPGFSQMAINHGVVLTKPSVQTAISQLLSGQTPSALLPETD